MRITKKTWIWAVLLLLLSAIQAGIGIALDLEGKDFLDVVKVWHKAFEYLDVDLPWGATLILSVVVQGGLAWLGSYWYSSVRVLRLFPRLTETLYKHETKKSELAYVARTLLEKEIKEHNEMLDHVSTGRGSPVASYKLYQLYQSFLERTTAKRFCMTTLGRIPTIFYDDNLWKLTRSIVGEVKRRKGKLERFYLVHESSFNLEFDLNKRPEAERDAFRQFVELHSDKSFVDLFFVSKGVLGSAADMRAFNFGRNMLDVLLFDGRLVFGLINNATTLTVEPIDDKTDPRPKYLLYAIDDKDTVEAYGKFFDSLASDCRGTNRLPCGLVIDELRSSGLTNQYRL